MKSLKSLFLLYFFSCLSLESVAKHISFEEAYEANKILNNLVDAIRSNPDHFSNKNINKYVRNFHTFQQYVVQLEKESGSTDNKVLYYKQQFLAPYQMYYEKIVQHAEEHPTELQEIERILNQVNQQVIQAFDIFSQTMKGAIGTLENYNENKKQEFFDTLQGAVKTFETRISSRADEAVEDFFTYQREQGKEVNPNRPTPVERTLLKGVRNLMQDAILQVHALSLDLTAEHINLDFSSQTAAALKRYEQEAEDNYKRALEDHKAGTDKTWFEGLKTSGSRFIDGFKQEFKKQASVKLKEEGQRVAKELGGALKDKGLAGLKELSDKAEADAWKAAAQLGEKTKQEAIKHGKKISEDIVDNVKKKLN